MEIDRTNNPQPPSPSELLTTPNHSEFPPQKQDQPVYHTQSPRILNRQTEQAGNSEFGTASPQNHEDWPNDKPWDECLVVGEIPEYENPICEQPEKPNTVKKTCWAESTETNSKNCDFDSRQRFTIGENLRTNISNQQEEEPSSDESIMTPVSKFAAEFDKLVIGHEQALYLSTKRTDLLHHVQLVHRELESEISRIRFGVTSKLSGITSIVDEMEDKTKSFREGLKRQLRMQMSSIEKLGWFSGQGDSGFVDLRPIVGPFIPGIKTGNMYPKIKKKSLTKATAKTVRFLNYDRSQEKDQALKNVREKLNSPKLRPLDRTILKLEEFELTGGDETIFDAEDWRRIFPTRDFMELGTISEREIPKNFLLHVYASEANDQSVQKKLKSERQTMVVNILVDQIEEFQRDEHIINEIWSEYEKTRRLFEKPENKDTVITEIRAAYYKEKDRKASLKKCLPEELSATCLEPPICSNLQYTKQESAVDLPDNPYGVLAESGASFFKDIEDSVVHLDPSGRGQFRTDMAGALASMNDDKFSDYFLAMIDIDPDQLKSGKIAENLQVTASNPGSLEKSLTDKKVLMFTCESQTATNIKKTLKKSPIQNLKGFPTVRIS